MYELLSGEKGVIQALGRRMGVRGRPPYIYLDQDDRSGASAEGENLYLDLLRRALILPSFTMESLISVRWGAA